MYKADHIALYNFEEVILDSETLFFPCYQQSTSNFNNFISCLRL